ncbi:MAG: hypothetical protein M1816_002440 [Peltula sp. TS41687]|nr:MAG: hypothetical protein M1816_002440 [Peltula sp. TS41687]
MGGTLVIFKTDWGDYISFAQRMREIADERGVDLLLIDTGDRVEGNGLYDASHPKGNYTSEIFKQQPIDVLCSGNHELYKKHTAEEEYLVTAPDFKGHYLASNIDIINPISGDMAPLAPRFRKFTTPNQGIRILSFGFLFDFTGNYNNTVVQPVEETIKEDWFQDAIRDQEVDLFLVIGHVPVRSPEYKAIFTAIRKVRWDTPIQFFGGHTHIRDYTVYDSKTTALESGRFMETLGWMSIDGLSTSSPKYARRYIDNNLFSFYHHTGMNESTFPTEEGQTVSRYISEARKTLQLDRLIGCAPQDYWLNRAPYPSAQSILTWIQGRVLPDIVHEQGSERNPRLVIINTGAMRFDIFKGPFTLDTTYIVSPFTTGFRSIKSVPYEVARRLLLVLNNAGPIYEDSESATGFQTSMLAPPEQISIKHDIIADAQDDHSHHHQIPLKSASVREEPEPRPGYTTKDDAGEDGDDTIHSPISFYRVPNCIQAKVDFPEQQNEEDPETVDVIFLEFIEPWILMGLKFLGEEYQTEDVDDFARRRSFTSFIADWVDRNWEKDC